MFFADTFIALLSFNMTQLSSGMMVNTPSVKGVLRFELGIEQLSSYRPIDRLSISVSQHLYLSI